MTVHEHRWYPIHKIRGRKKVLEGQICLDCKYRKTSDYKITHDIQHIGLYEVGCPWCAKRNGEI